MITRHAQQLRGFGTPGKRKGYTSSQRRLLRAAPVRPVKIKRECVHALALYEEVNVGRYTKTVMYALPCVAKHKYKTVKNGRSFVATDSHKDGNGRTWN